jgi:hypothetical protein
MRDRTSHLAGFQDDFKPIKKQSSQEIEINPCSDCPTMERSTGCCSKFKECAPYKLYMATSMDGADVIFMMQGTAG